MPTFDDELKTHIPDLLAHAMSLTRDYHAGKDLLQDTMVKALKGRESFKPGTDMRRWLFRIMRNRFTDEMRSRQRRPCDYLGNMEHFGSYKAPQFHAVEFKEACAAIDKLPHEFRRSLIVATLGDESFKDVSAQSRTPIGTMKARVYRARKALRDFNPLT